MKGNKRILFLALTISIFCSGCAGEVKNIVTGMIKGTAALIQGARDYIPANCSKYGDPYVDPWPDPGFVSTPDDNTGHSGGTGDSYNTFNAQPEIPHGISSEDLEGKAVQSQLSPSENTTIETMKDSYDAFNQ